MKYFNKYIFIALIILLICLGLSLFLESSWKSKSKQQIKTLKENSISVTQAKENKIFFAKDKPFYELYGKIESIEENKLYLSVPATIPSSKKEQTTNSFVLFEISLTPKTKIEQQMQYIPSTEFKNTNEVALSSLKPGMYITVSSSKDLNTLSSSSFEANKIQLPNLRNLLFGTIEEVQDKNLTVKRDQFAEPWNPSDNQLKYKVKVDRTEGFLKDMHIKIYALEDVEKTDMLSAFYIEILKD